MGVAVYVIPRSLTGHDAGVPVGSFLYLWYGSPYGSDKLSGWNSSSFPGGGAVVDKPVIGYYSSDNDSTFSWQIQEMQSAGLTFSIVSWWGPYSAGESGSINNATHDLFRYLQTSDSKFKVAIMVDAYLPPGEQNSSAYHFIYNYIYSEFVIPYRQYYFDWEGKPLLLFFNPMYPTFLNSSFTVRTIGNRPNLVNWSFWDAPEQFFSSQLPVGVNATNDEGNPVISSDGEVTVIPRIDSFYNYLFGYQSGYLRFDSSLTQGLYQSQWNYILSKSSDVKLVILYSWNEYHERTEIEPHYDYSNSSLSPYYLLNLTSYYVHKLEGS